MKLNNILFSVTAICVAFAFSFETKAQQEPLSNQYWVNPYSYNPAFAGTGGKFRSFLGVRKQWVGINGAPTLSSISIDGMVKDKIAVGGRFMSEQTHIINNMSSNLTFSYKVKLADDHVIGLGLEGEIENHKINTGEITGDLSDQLLTDQSVVNGTILDANFGVHYRNKDLQVGLTVPNLMESPLLVDLGNEDVSYQHRRHILTSVSYFYEIKAMEYAVEPIMFMRYAMSGPFQFDIGSKFIYKDMAWAGLMYRYQSGLVTALGFSLNEMIDLGYMYEVPTGNVATQSSGSHELYMGLYFGKNVDEEEQMRKEMEEKDLMMRNNMDSLGGLIEELMGTVNELKKANEQLNEENHEEHINTLEDEIKQMKQKLREMNGEVEEGQEGSDVELTNSEKDAIANSAADIRTSKDMGPVKAITVNEQGVPVESDLDAGYYVVIGAFSVLDNANRMKTELTDVGQDALIVKNPNRGYYYVYTGQTTKLQEAIGVLEGARSSGYDDAWIFVFSGK